jgi:hypothetical protein
MILEMDPEETEELCSEAQPILPIVGEKLQRLQRVLRE